MGQLTRVSSGIAGLDRILLGGLIPQRAYLVHGPPGAGKTETGARIIVELLQQELQKFPVLY